MAKTLITGAEYFNGISGKCERGNILLTEDVITSIGVNENTVADFHIDAAGCLITAGLVDGHMHFFPLGKNGVHPEAYCYPSGVTSAADAGSAGSGTFTQMMGYMVNRGINAKYWLNISSTGLSGLPCSENVDFKFFNKEAIKEIFAAFPTMLMGLKIRTSVPVVGELGYEPLRKTVALAEELGVPVMVHCTNPPGSIDELLDTLRPGDIMTHVFQNTGHSILDDRGQVSKAVWAARERGVLFEAADASVHFSFEVALQALKEGFYPDYIATDGVAGNCFRKPTSFSMAMQLNKYISMGMPKNDVIKACTIASAKKMGLYPQRGNIETGKKADLAIWRYCDVPTVFGDRPENNPTKKQFEGKITLCPVMTIKNGTPVYREITF